MARKKSTKSSTKWWTPPYNHEAKRFKSSEEWTKKDWSEYRKAKREGRIKATYQAKKQLRGPKGKFTSAKPRKELLARSDRGKAHDGAVGGLTQFPVEPVWVEREHQCPPCIPDFPDVSKKLVDPLTDIYRTVKESARDIEILKERSRIQANPIESLAIINRTSNSGGFLSKISDAAKENPLIAMALVGAAILFGYLMYKSYRRALEARASTETAVAELAIPREAERPSVSVPWSSTYIPSKPDSPSNLNLPQSAPAFGDDKDSEGIFS